VKDATGIWAWGEEPPNRALSKGSLFNGLETGEAAMNKVFVVSDGTGRTAEQALEAAMTQFASLKIETRVRPKVRNESKVRKVVREAAESGGLIVHTLVSDKLRELMMSTGRKNNVETVDLMGPLLARLSSHFSVSPAEKPGLFGQLNEEYFRRIETMEFAIHHDDGLRVHEARKAEIVLLGVSRTFKTPLSIYLAFKGWFVANVPIILNSELPPVLTKLPPARVFCMDTNPHQLSILRRTRQEALGGAAGEYASPDYVRLELMYARRLFMKQAGWSIINVTGKPIEEIAQEILAIRRSKGGRK